IADALIATGAGLFTAGIAAKSPAPVAISASAMPGATTARLVDPVWLMRSKAMMMPHTVPNRPTNGAMLAVVARNDTRRSSLLISTTDARIRARSTAVRLFRVGRPAGGRGLGPLLASGAAWRSWAVSSAYPD